MRNGAGEGLEWEGHESKLKGIKRKQIRDKNTKYSPHQFACMSLNSLQHRWTPLVVICVECRRYAARWLCDDCEEVYCVGCYASVHRHGSKVIKGEHQVYPSSIYWAFGLLPVTPTCKLILNDNRLSTTQPTYIIHWVTNTRHVCGSYELAI